MAAAATGGHHVRARRTGWRPAENCHALALPPAVRRLPWPGPGHPQRGPDAAPAAVRRRLPPGLGTGLVSRTCRRAQRQRGGTDRPGRALPPPPARRSAPPRVGGTSRQRGPSRSMTRLSVNVNKVAVLRNSRGGRDPDVLAAARACLAAGAHGITVHPRPDRRHIVAEDLAPLAAATAGYGVEFNIEGNPFAPPREDRQSG